MLLCAVLLAALALSHVNAAPLNETVDINVTCTNGKTLNLRTVDPDTHNYGMYLYVFLYIY